MSALRLSPAQGVQANLYPAGGEGKCGRRADACGQSHTLLYLGQVVYVVDVFSDDGTEHVGCGLPGRTVTFRVAGLPTAAAAAWDTGLVREVALTPAWRLFVPVIRR